MASPITPTLKSSARSAYRALFRASGATFAGDDRVLHAFREKVRTETVAGQQEVDAVEYEARVKHAFEVADVLKKNVVQAAKQGEAQDATWKLRMTSDTELGSNEGVKAPYSRPTRGQPRSKCGEDPNAVSPLPPRSLRHMVGSNSTRSYSTAASSSESSNPNPSEQPQEQEYDRVRVQSVRDRLREVNRRVLASPTGRELPTERMLVEDKLSALVARMEFLATEMHDKLYPRSSNTAPAQTLVELLLDHIPISPKSAVDIVGPPVQLQQYTRYLQNAARHANTVRTKALSLSPEVRTAIAALVETPSPGTRNPDNVLEQLSAIQWRLLMIKRGLQGILRSREVSPSEIADVWAALRNAMRNISYAQDSIEDMQSHGPRVENARVLVEEMEKSSAGSYLLELRKEMERRLEAGIAGKRVEEALISHGLTPAGIQVTRKVYRRLCQYEEHFPRVLDVITKAQEEDNMGYTKKWRRKPFTRCQRILNALRTHSEVLNTTLDQLIALHSDNDEKATLLREVKLVLNVSTDVDDEYIKHITGKVKNASWLEWAEVVSSRLDLVKELVERTVAADRYLEQYAWGESRIWEMDTNQKDLFFKARVELVIIYDVTWRLERRVKQDVEDLREVSALLCEEVQSEFHIPRPASMEHNHSKTTIPPWTNDEHRVKRPYSNRNRPKPTPARSPRNPSTAEEINTFLIFDE